MDPSSNILWAAQAHGLQEAELASAFDTHILTSKPSSSE
jgi:hypothetical protein